MTTPLPCTPEAGFMPYLICANAAAAIDFYKAAFGAEEVIRVAAPNGKIVNASLLIGGARLMLMDEAPEWGALGPLTLGGTGLTIHRFVADVDAAVAQAVAAGATLLMPVADQFWGDRYGSVKDPFGHQWSLATHQREVSAEEMHAVLANMPDNPEGCAP